MIYFLFLNMQIPSCDTIARMDIKHGTINAYNNHKCRCEACKLAHREYQLVRVPIRKSKGLEPGDSRHGTYNGYANYGCRCEACKEANRIYSIDYRLRTGRITLERAIKLRGF